VIGIGVCDRSVCVASGCGNGVIESAGGELCDDGNRISLDGCSADCKSTESCGDGAADPAIGEACDEGAENSDASGAMCRSDCTLARCGDNVVDPFELCDDGNNVPGDGCRADCAGRWTTMQSGTFADLTGVWGSSASDVWAVGDQRLVHYDGTAWQVTTRSPKYRAVWGSGASSVFAASDVSVERYNGSAWSLVPGSTGNWSAAWGDGSGTLYFGGTDDGTNGVIGKWNGTVFTATTVGSTICRSIWGTAADNVYAACGTLLYRSTGGSWSAVGGVSGVQRVWGTAPDDIYAFTSSGIYRYNGTWTLVPGASEIYPASSFGGVVDDLVLTGPTGRMMTWNGIVWSNSPVPTEQDLNGVWLNAKQRGFVVGGNGIILY
jgi:cysteine-rich repeat protein